MLAAPPALAQDWQVSTGSPYAKAGFAEGQHFYYLYVICEGPTGITLILDDDKGAHRAGARVSVRVAAGGDPQRFRGRVEADEMNGSSSISVALDADTARDLFANLSAGSSARVTWPNVTIDVPLAGSSAALKAFARACPAMRG